MADKKEGYFYTTKNGKVAYVPEEKSCDGAGGAHIATDAERERLKKHGIKDDDNVFKVDVDSDFQKALEEAETPKERQKIAFRYIMNNLRGKYTASDGRTVAIERVGADKITSKYNRDKLRVCPALADMIKAGEYDHSSPSEDKKNKKFEEFAYYRVRVQLGDDIYDGMLNVGIRKDGSSTLYDLRPFHKEETQKK